MIRTNLVYPKYTTKSKLKSSDVHSSLLGRYPVTLQVALTLPLFYKLYQVQPETPGKNPVILLCNIHRVKVHVYSPVTASFQARNRRRLAIKL